MELPISTKESFEEFKVRYEKRMEGDTFTHWRTIYYEACQQPINMQTIVFTWHGNVTNSEVMYQFLKYWCEHKKTEDVKVYVVTARKAQLEMLPDLPEDCIVLAKDLNRPQISELYGTAGCIVTSGWLPAFFVRREGQQVINLYEPLDEDINYYRLKNADRRLSSFLNSSVIWVQDQSMIEKVRQREDFEDLYEGQFMSILPDKKSNGDFSCLLDYIFNQDTSNVIFTQSHPTRKNLIIYYETNNKFPYYELLRQFTYLVDYKKWNVILLSQKPSSETDEARLMCLHPSVKIIYTVNNYNSSVQEYLSQKYLLEDLLTFEDVFAAWSELDGSVLRSEFQGILGSKTIDEFLYFGDYSSYSLSFILSMSVKRARKVEIEDFSQKQYQYQTPEQALVFQNMLKLYAEVYDKLVFPSKKIKNSAMEIGHYEDSKLQVFSFPALFSYKENDRSYQVVEIHQRPYAVLKYQEQAFQNLYMEVMPCLAEGEKGYLIDTRQTDSASLFKLLKEQKVITADKWFIAGLELGELRDTAIRNGLEDQVVVINAAALEGWENLSIYLQQFAGYITTAEKDCSFLRIAMELFGKDVFLFSESGIKQITDPAFPDLESYNVYVEECMKQFLDSAS